MHVLVVEPAGVLGRSVIEGLLQYGYRVTVWAPWSIGSAFAAHPRFHVLKRPLGVLRNVRIPPADVLVHMNGRGAHHPASGSYVTYAWQQKDLERLLRHGRNKLRRVVFLSTLGAGPRAAFQLQERAWQCEEIIRQSGIEHVIFRSSWIFAWPEHRLRTFRRDVRLFTRVPFAANPEQRVQPVAAANIVEGVVKAVRLKLPGSKTYDVGGPKVYTLQSLVAALAQEADSTRLSVRWSHATDGWPAFLARRLVPSWAEGRLCRPHDFYYDFCIHPLPLERVIGTAAADTSRLLHAPAPLVFDRITAKNADETKER